MTLYVVDVTVPPDTPKEAPVEYEVEVWEEVIVSLECHFPLGCRGRVYTAVYYGEEQLFPRPFGVYLRGDGETIKWQEYYELPHVPCVLRIRAWSPGTRYPHTIIWRLNALPRNIAKWWTNIVSMLNLISLAYSFFGRRG